MPLNDKNEVCVNDYRVGIVTDPPLQESLGDPQPLLLDAIEDNVTDKSSECTNVEVCLFSIVDTWRLLPGGKWIAAELKL